MKWQAIELNTFSLKKTWDINRDLLPGVFLNTCFLLKLKGQIIFNLMSGNRTFICGLLHAVPSLFTIETTNNSSRFLGVIWG